MIEIAATVDVAEAFVKKTAWNGNVTLPVVSYDYVIELQNHTRFLHMPNVIRLNLPVRWLVQVNLLLHSSITTSQACQCAQPALEYFQNILGTAD